MSSEASSNLPLWLWVWVQTIIDWITILLGFWTSFKVFFPGTFYISPQTLQKGISSVCVLQRYNLLWSHFYNNYTDCCFLEWIKNQLGQIVGYNIALSILFKPRNDINLSCWNIFQMSNFTFISSLPWYPVQCPVLLSDLQVVGKDYVDAKVVEAHIVPGQLLLTSLIPTQEVSTVAWDSSGVRVNVSLQPSYAQEGSVMVR